MKEEQAMKEETVIVKKFAETASQDLKSVLPALQVRI